MKTLLALGASRLNLPAARAMSSIARVIAVDRAPFELIDEPQFKTVQLDFANQSELLSFSRNESIDGVYPFSDHAIRPAAMLCATYGLLGLQGGAAENFLDKSKMREIWHKNRLTQPIFGVALDLLTALQLAEEIGYPVILKPAASGGGGRGVFRIDSPQELTTYYPKVILHNRYSNQILIEQYVVGIESSLELVFVEGQATMLAISTKEKPNTKSQVATEIVYPAELTQTVIDRIYNLCVDAALTLGLVSGLAHFEVITTPEGIPYLVEVGGRAGGGHTLHPIVSHVSGVNYPELLANLYLGEMAAVRMMLLGKGGGSKGAVYSFPVTNHSGVIKRIGFLNSGVGSEIELWTKTGDVIAGMTSSMDRLGCVISLGKTREIAKRESCKIMKSFYLDFE
jgi:biotin carboxylase